MQFHSTEEGEEKGVCGNPVINPIHPQPRNGGLAFQEGQVTHPCTAKLARIRMQGVSPLQLVVGDDQLPHWAEVI